MQQPYLPSEDRDPDFGDGSSRYEEDTGFQQTDYGHHSPTTQDPDQRQQAIDAAIQRYENNSAELTEALRGLSNLIEKNTVRGKFGAEYLKLKPDDDRTLHEHMTALTAALSHASFLLGETYLPRATSTPQLQLTKDTLTKLIDFITKYQTHPFHTATYRKENVRIYPHPQITTPVTALKNNISEITAHLAQYADFARHDYRMVSSSRGGYQPPHHDPYGDDERYDWGRGGRYRGTPYHETRPQDIHPLNRTRRLVDPETWNKRAWGY